MSKADIGKSKATARQEQRESKAKTDRHCGERGRRADARLTQGVSKASARRGLADTAESNADMGGSESDVPGASQMGTSTEVTAGSETDTGESKAEVDSSEARA